MKVFLIAAAFVGAMTSPVTQQSPDATLDRAVAVYGKVKTVRASFTQELTNPLTGSKATSRGELQQRPPSQLAVRWTDPAGDAIVASGNTMWVYLPSSAPNQVIKLRPDALPGGTPDVTAQFLSSPHTRYTVSGAGTSSIDGRPAHAIKLVPKVQGMPFSEATVWIDDADAYVRQFETKQLDGVVRRVTITKLAINGPLSPNAFVFVPPAGARIIDQSGTAP